MYYSYAKFDGRDIGILRLPPGAGLANLLFPWARFIVGTKKYNLTPISPTWFQLQLGPLLRGESDKRFYNDLFLTPKNQIAGLKKLYLLNTLKKVPSDEFKLNYETQTYNEDILVIFGGRYKKLFSEFLTENNLVYQELLDITLDKHKQGLNYNFKASISVHVRLGDFIPPDKAATEKGALNYRIPISWYIQQINQIREYVKCDIPVYIFSDGKDIELAELLALPNVRRITFGSSIADLLALANSNVLVASGSTFSMWASFLGRMPVIWHKGQRKQKLYYEAPYLEVETDKVGLLPKELLERIALTLVDT